MSAIDELRRLLEECGEEHIDYCDTTAWLDGSHVARAVEYNDQLLVERVMTPEQAIAATLGNDGVVRSKNGVDERTTTRNTTRTFYGNPRPVCEVCGYGIGDKRWHYCPNCGARIVEVD